MPRRVSRLVRSSTPFARASIAFRNFASHPNEASCNFTHTFRFNDQTQQNHPKHHRPPSFSLSFPSSTLGYICDHFFWESLDRTFHLLRHSALWSIHINPFVSDISSFPFSTITKKYVTSRSHGASTEAYQYSHHFPFSCLLAAVASSPEIKQAISGSDSHVSEYAVRLSDCVHVL